MGEITALTTVRQLWDYHWWANRRLLEVATALGDEALGRPVGPQFSCPTIQQMFAHLYGADWIWLRRWQGVSPSRLPGQELGTLAALGEAWEVLRAEQRAYLDGLAPADLGRMVEWKSTEGEQFRLPLGVLLHHVPNHATHHRSEIATMITMVSASPPGTGLVTYQLLQTGQRDMSRRWA